MLRAYFSVPALLVLVSLWAVYIQFPTGWNFVFPFLLLRLLFFLKIGGHFRQKCVFGSLLPLWLGLGPFWKEGNFHFVYKEGLVFFGCPINLLGREFGAPRIIYRDQERYFKGISLIFKNIIHSAFFCSFSLTSSRFSNESQLPICLSLYFIQLSTLSS